MPSINLRLSEEELGVLRVWARGSRRSLQREVVFRLFEGALTERGEAVAKVPEGVAVQDGKSQEGSLPGRAPRSVSVPSEADNGPMRARPHMKKGRPAVECPTRVWHGVCPDCGADVDV